MDHPTLRESLHVLPGFLQPDYTAWARVKTRMSREEVREILGDPVGEPQGHWLYGYLEQVIAPKPRTYEFLVGFGTDDRVCWKIDPFRGRFSADGTPTRPDLLLPASGAVFSHFPRILDIRWTPCAGEYPMTYRLEAQVHAPDLDEYDGGCPDPGIYSTYYALQWGGAQRGRLRVRGENRLGPGPWTPWRYFAFSV